MPFPGAGDVVACTLVAHVEYEVGHLHDFRLSSWANMERIPTKRIRWFDDHEMAYAFLRSRFFRVRRKGHVRLLNSLVNAIKLPISIANLLVLTIPLCIFFVSWAMRLIGRTRQDQGPERLSSYGEKIKSAVTLTSALPPALILAAINRWQESPSRRHFLDNRPCVLYLRSFKMDQYRAVTPHDLPLVLEDFLRGNMRYIGPMVALGRETKAEAQRVELASEDWQNEIVRLMLSAGLIILVPEDTQGTRWEIERILESSELVQKTVFLNIAAAGRDHPYWNRERLIYNDNDGMAFADTLNRIAGSTVDIPLATIAGAAFINNELNIFCAKTLFDTGLWAALPGIVAFLKHRETKACPTDAQQAFNSTFLPPLRVVRSAG